MEFQNPLTVARAHLGFTGKLVFVTTIQKMMARRTSDQMCFIWQRTFRKTELAMSFVSRMIQTLEKEGEENICLLGHLNSTQNLNLAIMFCVLSDYTSNCSVTSTVLKCFLSRWIICGSVYKQGVYGISIAFLLIIKCESTSRILFI